MYTGLDIARFIIDFCYSYGRPVSNLELQKILYFLQVAYMRHNNGRELISDDFCAWQYGPVIPSVYSIFSAYGGALIKNSYNASNIVASIADFIRPLIRTLESMGPWALVDLSHEKGSPWDITYKKGRGNGEIIPKTLIAEDDALDWW